jgi:DNA-directed RNA polymerase specialized sigma24 family protein
VSPPSLRRYRAERLLRKDFFGLRSKVLAIVRSQLRGKGVSFDPADLEACYAQAWQGLYTAVLGGEQVENPSAWLVLVTFRRAIDESRSAGRSHVGGYATEVALDSDIVEAGRQAVSNPDLAAALDDRARLRHVFEGLRERLSPRECEAASLCYLQGLSRAEAATRIGIGETRMRKLMEGTGPSRPGVAGKVGALLDAIREESWCEQQSSLMRAYAFGLLDPDGERHTLAVAHCRECPACRAYVASLRGLAAVLPPLPLRLVLRAAARTAPGVGSGASSGTGASSGAGGAGWSGSAGSLTAKLAVTGLIALGGGYAVLDNRAHGSPAHGNPAPRLGARAPLPVGKKRSLVPHPKPSAPTDRRRSARHSAASHARAVGSTRPTREPAALEFGPERIQPQPPSTPVRATHAPGEFGFE